MFCLESFKMIANGVSSFFIILSSVGYHKVYIINLKKKNASHFLEALEDSKWR